MEDTNGWYKPNIDRKLLIKLLERSNYEGWRHIIIYFLTLIFLGYFCYVFWLTWVFLPIYLIYCTWWGGADAIWHECGHRTAFKSRKLNDFFYHIGSFMNSFEAVRFKWSHSIHHNYTGSIDPHDFEVDESIFWKPKKLLNFFIIFIPGIGLLNLNKSIQKEILQHALGIKTKVMEECIPDHKKQSCILVSRIYVLLWISIIIFSMIINSVLPIFLFLIPKFFATLNIIWGLTQHIGLQDKVKDHRLSTRSIRLNPILSFIYWNMEYHIEHHMFPSVPSYNLPKLHEAIKHQLPKPQTLFQAYKEIIPAIIKKTNDPDYYIPVKIP